MKNIPLLIGTILGSLLLVGGLAFFFSGQGNTTATPETVQQEDLLSGARHTRSGQAKTATTSAQVSPQPSGASPASTASAEPTLPMVQIVEFSDFQCPACRAAQPIMTALFAKYGDRISLTYRHFPLDSLHPNARLAAQASEVMADQDLFWQFHDVLFLKQDDWADIREKQDLLAKFAEYATELQADTTDFASKVESQEISDRVMTDSQFGDKIGLQATPTFFVNGQSVSAPQLQAAVEQLVATQ